MSKIGCSACGGSGYVPAYVWTSTGVDGTDRPDAPNAMVPCRCLSDLERLQQRLQQPFALSQSRRAKG